MNNQPSNCNDGDSVQLTEQEKASKFTEFWTPERKQQAKLLAKKLSQTEFEVVEQNELRAEQLPEDHIVVTPTQSENGGLGGLREPDPPELHISTGSVTEDHLKVFRLTDNSHYPEE